MQRITPIFVNIRKRSSGKQLRCGAVEQKEVRKFVGVGSNPDRDCLFVVGLRTAKTDESYV